MSRAQVMPRLRISALSWMWVLGKRPPLTKKIFTPSSSTASPTITNVNNNVAITCVFRKKTCKFSDTLRVWALYFEIIFNKESHHPIVLTIIQSDKGKLTLQPPHHTAITRKTRGNFMRTRRRKILRLYKRYLPPGPLCRGSATAFTPIVAIVVIVTIKKTRGNIIADITSLRGRLPTLPLSQYHRRGEA